MTIHFLSILMRLPMLWTVALLTCASRFSPGAIFRKSKGAVKMHTQLDLRGSIPTFIEITDGKVHDINILDLLILKPGALYILWTGHTSILKGYTTCTNVWPFLLLGKNTILTSEGFILVRLTKQRVLSATKL